MDLTEKEFLDLCGDCLTHVNPDALSKNEKIIQVRIADKLLDAGHKVFCEYPYRESKDECDIVITEKNDCDKATHWIEVKPLWKKSECNYWPPSKFFGDAPFKKDVEKLSKIGNQASEKAWFLVVMLVDETVDSDTDDVDEPRKKKALTPEQVIRAISLWAMKKPLQRAIPNMGHLFLWPIDGYNKDAVIEQDGVYHWRK